jgi:hypothetical protein
MAEKPAILGTMSTANIRTDMLDNAIAAVSLPTLWEKSYLCPCRNRATRQPNQTCKICHGRGIAFMPARPLAMIVTSQEKGIFNGDLGLMDSGTALGTPDRDTQVAFRDRITIQNATVSQSFIFDVSQRRIDYGFYMVYDVHSIDFATSMKGELTEGVDYTLDLNRNLFFPKEHLLYENISINIQTTLRYMVADLLKEHRYARDPAGRLLKLPQKLLLKREDLFIDKEAFEVGVNDSEVGQMVDTKRPPAVDGLNGFFRNSGS